MKTLFLWHVTGLPGRLPESCVPALNPLESDSERIIATEMHCIYHAIDLIKGFDAQPERVVYVGKVDLIEDGDKHEPT